MRYDQGKYNTRMYELSQQCRDIRASQHMTQQFLADILGVDRKCINRFESGVPIRLDTFLRILDGINYELKISPKTNKNK